MGKVYFGQEEADHIFEELIVLDMDLDEDPLAFGPKRLNNKIALVRGMLSRCERVYLDVSQQLHAMKRSLKIETLTLDLAKKNLFANDPETRAGKSVSDREAIAAGKLHTEMMEVHDLEMAVESLSAVWMAIKTKRADLKDIEGRLKDQFRLCQEEIGLGSRWGSRAIGDFDLTPGIADQTEISNVTDLLQGVDEEIHLGKAEGTWEDPPEAEVDGDVDISVSEEEKLVLGETKIEETEIEDTSETAEKAVDAVEDDLDLETLLPPTTTPEELDAFMNQELVEPPKKKAQSKKMEVVEDDGLEDILATFEKE